MSPFEDMAQVEKRQKETIAFLKMQRNGHFLNDVAAALSELTDACMKTQKGGMITVKIAISPMGEDGAMEIADDVTVKLPRLPKGTSVFFTAPSGSLVKSDPRQAAMELAQLPQEPKTIHSLGDDTTPVETNY